MSYWLVDLGEMIDQEEVEGPPPLLFFFFFFFFFFLVSFVLPIVLAMAIDDTLDTSARIRFGAGCCSSLSSSFGLFIRLSPTLSNKATKNPFVWSEAGEARMVKPSVESRFFVRLSLSFLYTYLCHVLASSTAQVPCTAWSDSVLKERPQQHPRGVERWAWKWMSLGFVLTSFSILWMEQVEYEMRFTAWTMKGEMRRRVNG